MDYQQVKRETFAHLDAIFPEMELKMKSGKWTSFYHHSDGTVDRRRKGSQTAIWPDGAVFDWNGNSTDTVKLFQSLHPEFGEYNAAAREMLKRAGLNPDEFDSAPEAIKQRRDEWERLLANLRQNYTGTPGDAVRRYLAAPIDQGGRGWTDDDIKAAADYLAVVTDRAEFERVTHLVFGHRDPQSGTLTASTDWHTRTPLIIPTFDRQRRIRYAKTRSINGEKRFDNPNTQLSRLSFADVPMFNYNRATFDNNIPDRRRVVVVESELCAIRCTIRGISNVVALRGSAVTRNNVVKFVLDGASQIVLMLDNDKSAKQIRETVAKYDEYSDGMLDVLIATIPADLGKDPDEVITRHDVAHLRAVIDNAVSFNRWNAATYATEYTQAANDGDRLAVRQSALEHLATLDRHSQREFAATYATTTGNTFDADDMPDAASARQRTREQLKFGEQLRKASDRLSRAIDNGNADRINQAFADMMAIVPPTHEADPLANDPEFVQRTDEQLLAMLGDNGDDIITPFMFYGDRQLFPLRLKASGLTYICANTSHGKSTFIQNIAYWMATPSTTNGHPRPVLYYSLEENKTDVITEFVNIHIHNGDISRHTDKRNLSTDRNTTNFAVLREYFRTGKPDVFDALDPTPETVNERWNERQRIAAQIKKFIGTTINGTDKTLFIFDAKRDPDETPQLKLSQLPDLLRHIRAAVDRVHPAAIFIDYIQRVKSGERYLNTFDDLAAVADGIQTLAQDLRIPIVCAAQMNRSNGKLSPADMSLDNIAGSSAIEQGADVILLLYNSGKHKVERAPQGNPVVVDWPVGDPVTLGVPGHLFGLLAKNRGNIGRGHALFKYDAASRWIPGGQYSADTNGRDPDLAPATTGTAAPTPTPSATMPDDENNSLFDN